MRFFQLCCSLAVTVALFAQSVAAADPVSLTFVQLTDAHLFDEGWNEPMPEAFRRTANNWEALHWSIDQINDFVKSGKTIDFVVYTGDLGLQNVSFPRANGCLAEPAHLETGLPPIPSQMAAHDLLAELDRLAVRRVYFVSGNNDPIDEQASDGRYSCFLSVLREQARQKRSDLVVQSLDTDMPIFLRGFTILGLNSGSFKKEENYSKLCSRVFPDDVQQRLQRTSCPEQEMTVLEQQIAAGKPTLLFTHVPDLEDPYRHEPAWNITRDVRDSWEQAVNHPNLLAVFAGHLHSSDRNLYGSTKALKDLASTKPISTKLYVAPPLAVKNQVNAIQSARGLLLVTALPDHISHVDVFWYEDAILTARR